MPEPADLPVPPTVLPRYEQLYEFLLETPATVLDLSFNDIHRLGCSLPFGARVDPAWWSNAPEADPQRISWLAAGRRVQEVDVERSRVWFAAAEGSAAIHLFDEARAKRTNNNDTVS